MRLARYSTYSRATSCSPERISDSSTWSCTSSMWNVPPFGWRRTSAATTLLVNASTSSRMRAETAPWPPAMARKALVIATEILCGSNATTEPLRRMTR